MSILIKGMNMPTDCIVCPFGWNGCNNQHNFVYMGSRPKDCPLVEVPTPHGHLIDSAELLSAKFAGIYHDSIVSDGVEKTDKEVYAYRVGWNDALDAAYLNAPIVISAEGKEE